MLSIYKASAGSGKTFTLAYEYIKMLLGHKNTTTGKYSLRKKPDEAHRHILAITFTNKATEEMKRRIVLELARLAGMDGSNTTPYSAMLMKEFGCSEQDLQSTARTALHRLLFDFNFFNVSTIDSFFQTILRTFAREAELTGNYELQLDNSEAIAEGIHRFFNSLTLNSGDPGTTRSVSRITAYLTEQFNQGKGIMLFNRDSTLHQNLIKTIAGLSNEKFTNHFSELMDYFSDPERLERFEKEISSRIETVIANAKKECASLLSIIAATENTTRITGAFKVNFVKAIEKCAQSGDAPGITLVTVHTAGPAKAYNSAFIKYLDAHPGESPDDAVERAVSAVMQARAEVPLLRHMRINIFILSLIAGTYGFIEEYRTENNAVLLADTTSLINKIIGNEDTPFIYERLGLMLHNYLIDEFQDTSRLQWQNLSHLVGEGTSHGSDSLIIGDEKQCIYRFRNSDPTLLQSHVAQQFGGNCTTRGNSPGENTNWRSSATIVDFNNKLFAALAARCGFDDIYSNVTQQISPAHASHPGYVSVTPVDCKNVAEYDEIVLPRLAADIDSQLAAGYKPSQIVILVRNKDKGELIIQYLAHRQSEDAPYKYNIISDDLIKVSQSPAVSMIISHLQNLADPDSSTSSSIYKSRRETAHMLADYQLARHSGESQSAALAAAIARSNASTVPDSNAPTLTDLVENIIATLPPDMLAEQNCHICAFQDLLTDYCAYGLNDIRSFLKWWAQTGRNRIVSAPEDPNAIRVMTIHKSKGLEFSCVHVPYVTWQILKFKDVEWFDTDCIKSSFPADSLPPIFPIKPGTVLEGTAFEPQYRSRCSEQTLDELNVLYVAFTRAVDELRVHYFPESKATMPIGDELDNIMSTTFSGARQPLGGYTFGAPTVAPPHKDKTPDKGTPTSATPMPPYFTGTIPPDNEHLDIDYSPDPEF